MSLDEVAGFVWQYRTIYDCFDMPNPSKVMGELWVHYKDVTVLFGSGKLVKNKDYPHFMESKWAETYRRTHGLEKQIEKYNIGVVEDGD